MLAPFNLQNWVKDNKDKFTPPIGNHQLYKEQWENLLIMVIGGENYRPDYHDDPGEELFYQVTGDLTLKIIDPAFTSRPKTFFVSKRTLVLTTSTSQFKWR